jgi:hypothetical protein
MGQWGNEAMTEHECPHEDDVMAAVNTGRWPARADADLRAHVAGCLVCQDVVAVAEAFRDAEADASIRVPEAGAVWLRAQIRARAENTRLAERPISVAQAIAFASTVGVLGALFGAASPWLQGALRWIGGGLARLDPRALPLPTGIDLLVAEHLGIAAAIAAALILLPFAVYLTIRER